MKKVAPKKRNLSGTIKSAPSSASDPDQIFPSSTSNCLVDIDLWYSTFNAVEDAICIIDNDQRIVRCNRAMQKFSENENESVIGKHCYEIIHGTDHPLPECPVRKMQLTHQRERAEVKEREQWFDVTVDPLFGPDKQINGAVHIVRDITERKQAEEALRESEKMYRLLAQNLPGTTVFLFDHNLQFILAEGHLHPEFGFTASNMEGKTLWEVLPEDRAARLAPIYRNALQGIPTENLISEFKGHSYSVNILPVKNKRHEIIAGMVVSQEITQRKLTEDALSNSEKKWKKLVNTLPDFVALYDRDGKYLFLNHFAEGFSAKDIEGKTYLDYIPDDSKHRYEKAFTLAKQTNSNQYVEHLAPGNNRTLRNYESFFVPIFEGNEFVNMMVIARDISDRKRAEAALYESEEIFNQFLENSPIYVFFKDENIRALRLSRNYEQMLGIPLEELLGKSMDELFPSELAKSMVANDQSILKKKERIEIEEELNGRYFSTIKFPIQIEGKPAFLAGFTMDITERKLADVAIRESEERFRSLLQNVSSVSVQGYAPDGTTQYWNKASEKLYGYTEQEAIGHNLLELIIPPEMRDVVEQAILYMAQTGEPIPSSELSLMRKDGSRVSVFSSHSIVQSPGKPQELFCIDIDLTERKQIEAEVLKSKRQYDSLVSKIPVGVYILKTKSDSSFALEYVSPRMAELLGLSSDDLLTDNKAIFKAIHPEDLDSFVRLNQAGILNKVPFDWKGRVVVNGNIRWLQISSTPEQLDSGEMLWHGLIVDITEQMRDEAEIRLKNEELTNLNATKDKFFSIIAHDLKSPFNSIIGFSSLLSRQLQEKDFASIEKYAGIIQNSSQQAMDLLMNLLEWSQSQTGRMFFTPENINIVDLINQSTEVLNASVQQKSISVVSQTPVNLFAFADKAMINTILRNLISNAIKFTRTGGEIIISAEQLPTELLVSVSDNGVGMDEESISKLFRIDQNHTTLGTEKEKGTGLGLLLCKEFVEKHGGKIWVESSPGKGSKFSFSIPETKIPNTSA